MDILWVASSALEWDLLTGDVALNYYSLQPKNKPQKIKKIHGSITVSLLTKVK